MRTIRMKKTTFIIATILAFVLAALLVCMIAEASTPRNGRTRDAQGNIYIYKHGRLQTGWFKYHGKWYYGHKSKSVMYPKGAVARNTYRVRNGRMYYFTDSGAKLVKSTKFIKLFRGRTSVHYIQIPGSDDRFNARTQRWQRLVNGKWKDTGMQCWPYGWIDWQW